MAHTGSDLPRGKISRRIYWIVLGLVLGVLCLGRYLLLPAVSGVSTPSVSEDAASTLGDLIAAIVVAAFISALVLWLLPEGTSDDPIEAIAPIDIRSELNAALASADSWTFSGSAGRWNRSVALPALVERARLGGSTTAFTLMLVDPTNNALVGEYANYRRSIGPSEGEAWNETRARRDIYATIVYAEATRASNPQLRLEIYVKPSASMMRYDMSESKVIVTREDPRATAYKCSSGSSLYDWFRRDVDYLKQQSRKLSPGTGGFGLDELNPARVRELLTQLDLLHDALDDDEFVVSILEEVNENKRPYS